MTAIYAHRGNVAYPDDAAGENGAATSKGPMAPAGGGSGDPSGDAVPHDRAARENTLEAFGAARRAGADGVELDTRLTADDLPVIHHDRRLPDGRDLANIARDSLPHYVPTLEQALRACRGLSVNIEVKHEDGDRRAAAVVAAQLGPFRTQARPGCRAHATDGPPGSGLPSTGGPPGSGLPSTGLPPVLVSSFDGESLAVVGELQPWVPRGLLIDWHTDPATGLARAAALGCATLHPFVTQVDPGLVDAAADAGIGLHVWTVNADADLREMADLGVVAVITDRVTAAVRILRGPNGGGVTG